MVAVIGGRITTRLLEEGDRTGWEVLWLDYQQHMKMKLPGERTDAIWEQLMNEEAGLWGVCAFIDTYRLAGIGHFSIPPATLPLLRQAHILDLYVAETLRGKGAGRALTEAIFRLAAEMGARETVWIAPTSNFRAKLLFDKVCDHSELVMSFMKRT